MEVGNMSPKELLYIEDALGHEKQAKSSCQSAAQQLQDAQLKNFVSQLAEKHGECFNRFYGLLK
jgi:hypothetical protein